MAELPTFVATAYRPRGRSKGKVRQRNWKAALDAHRTTGVDVKLTLRLAADAAATGIADTYAAARHSAPRDGVPKDASLCVPVKPTVSNRCFPCIPCRPSSLTGGMVFRWASQSSPRRRRSPVLSP
jgi:hypothetical protein